MSQAQGRSNYPLVLSRMMMPEDANVRGNVHGGTLLKLIAEAGYIASARHCNSADDGMNRHPVYTAIARVEHTDFINPVFIGELVTVYAAVTFTSERSMEVTADVWSEDLISGRKRKTNHARMWYVAVLASSNFEERMVVERVPQLDLSQEELAKGKERYLFQKQDRHSKQATIQPAHDGSMPDATAVVEHSPAFSQSALIQVVLPHDCLPSGHLQGGPLMKLMDSCAGVVATRHGRTGAVTASLEAIDFLEPVVKGELITVKGRLIFTSAKSMQILVTVEAENIKPNSHRVTNEAYFTFVSLDRSGKPLSVPQVVPQTDRDRRLYEFGKKRYEVMKQKREAERKLRS